MYDAVYDGNVYTVTCNFMDLVSQFYVILMHYLSGKIMHKGISVDQLQFRVEVKKSTGAQVWFSPFIFNPISSIKL